MAASIGANGQQVEHRGLLTMLVMTATLMQIVDSTIANVALPYMQGSLSTTTSQITWVLTSYVIVSAIMTAPVGWMAQRFGRKTCSSEVWWASPWPPCCAVLRNRLSRWWYFASCRAPAVLHWRRCLRPS